MGCKRDFKIGEGIGYDPANNANFDDNGKHAWAH